MGKGPGRSLVRIILDTPVGDGRVTLDACAAVSREVGHALDAEDLIPGSYTLEVCSPGVDRLLAREKDFERVVGRRVELRTRRALDGRKRFRGELLEFDGREARVQTTEGNVSIPFDIIARAKALFPLESGPQKR